MIDNNINEKAGELVQAAKEAGVTVGFAESLTGGMISSSVVNISGASAAFKGAVVSYTNEVKENVLGVPAEIIDKYNEVSEECAKAMAEGGAKVLGADLVISVTGIAGPTGELPGKPVGTVYMGYCFRNPVSSDTVAGARRLNFSGDRNTIRTDTVFAALDFAVKLIQGR